MTEADYLASRIASLTKAPKAAPEEPKAEEKPEPETPEPEAVAETPKEDAATEPDKADQDVLSKDIGELTDEEIRELANRGQSRLLKRVADLTARRKQAEERAAALERELFQRSQQVLQEPKIDNNPYAEIKTITELNKEVAELDSYIEWAEDTLDKNEGLPADAVVYQAGGKDYTRATIKEGLRSARKRKDKFVPAQAREIVKREQAKLMEKQFQAQARTELPWMNEEKGEIKERYAAMVSDPRIVRLKESDPELGPQVEYLVAHAANSIFGQRRLITDAKPATTPQTTRVSLTPPTTPAQSAAPSEKRSGTEDRSEKEARERLTKTGESSDFIALRAAQLTKRKTVK